MEDEFRVEVELDDEEHGYSVRERLRALDLDDDARSRLGKSVVVTRDGSRLFAYTSTEPQVRAAERVVRTLVDEEGLTAEIAVTRWHPAAEEWRDASLPLPATPEEEELEYEERETAELREAELEGEFDWRVVAELPSRNGARELATKLEREGEAVDRRWRYVLVGAATQERADELAARLRAKLDETADVWIEASLDDVAFGPFQFVGF